MTTFRHWGAGRLRPANQEPAEPLPPPRYPPNPSPIAKLGRWLFDRLTRR